MGIYIPGMEMPENCIICDLSHEDGWCPAKQDYVDRYSFETCPLVPVPPHGRLIDAEKLGLSDFDIARCEGDFKEGLKMLLEKIDEAPTIIPAEEA